jgi:hypothetical protein
VHVEFAFQQSLTEPNNRVAHPDNLIPEPIANADTNPVPDRQHGHNPKSCHHWCRRQRHPNEDDDGDHGRQHPWRGVYLVPNSQPNGIEQHGALIGDVGQERWV